MKIQPGNLFTFPGFFMYAGVNHGMKTRTCFLGISKRNNDLVPELPGYDGKTM